MDLDKTILADGISMEFAAQFGVSVRTVRRRL